MKRIEDIEIIEDGKIHVPDPELIDLANAILTSFMDQRPNYTPGRVSIPAKALPRFYEAAKLCKARKQTADEYVKQQLIGMSLTGQFWPSAIASAKLQEAAAQTDPTAVDIGRYKAMLATWAALAKTLGPELTIRDPQSPFSPLLRMLLAHEYGMNELAASLKDDALFEYHACAAAKDIFGDLLKQYGIIP